MELNWNLQPAAHLNTLPDAVIEQSFVLEPDGPLPFGLAAHFVEGRPGLIHSGWLQGKPGPVGDNAFQGHTAGRNPGLHLLPVSRQKGGEVLLLHYEPFQKSFEAKDGVDVARKQRPQLRDGKAPGGEGLVNEQRCDPRLGDEPSPISGDVLSLAGPEDRRQGGLTPKQRAPVFYRPAEKERRGHVVAGLVALVALAEQSQGLFFAKRDVERGEGMAMMVDDGEFEYGPSHGLKTCRSAGPARTPGPYL